VSDFNIAVVVDEPVANPRRAVREAIEWFAMRGANVRFDLRGSVDGALLAAATVEGCAFKFREAVMLLHPLAASMAPITRLDLREVTSDRDVELYCSVDREEFSDQDFQRAMVERSLQMEGVSLHLGLLEGRPVSRSMAIVRGELVGVHNVYTPPAFRKQGFGTALTAAAVEAGRLAGARAACLEATVLGFPVYERMGFERVDDYVVVGNAVPAFPT
jgi:GNAT superfamily N-acetyltransferase